LGAEGGTGVRGEREFSRDFLWRGAFAGIVCRKLPDSPFPRRGGVRGFRGERAFSEDFLLWTLFAGKVCQNLPFPPFPRSPVPPPHPDSLPPLEMPPPNPAWGSPLMKATSSAKKAAPPPDPIKELKKLQPKPRVSKTGARAILGEKHGVDELKALWVEQWIETHVRENSYPPQLVADDFIAQLGRFFAPPKALAILNALRREFAERYSWEKPTDYAFLEDAIRSDPVAAPLLGPEAREILRKW
jgi:hypothetical protein